LRAAVAVVLKLLAQVVKVVMAAAATEVRVQVHQVLRQLKWYQTQDKREQVVAAVEIVMLLVLRLR